MKIGIFHFNSTENIDNNYITIRRAVKNASKQNV